MAPISLLTTLIFVPGIEFFEPVSVLVGEGMVAVDTTRGTGEPLVEGQLATVEFSLVDGLGRSLADSSRRGLPFTTRVGQSDDPLLDPCLVGIRPGGSRRIFFAPNYLPQGLGSIVPPKTDLVLDIRVLIRSG